MHKILLASAILLLNSLITFSQLIKVENGISISSMAEKGGKDNLNNNATMLSITLGYNLK
jgi:hypothetical protein